MPNITELREKLRNMQNELKTLTTKAMQAADDPKATEEDLTACRNAVKAHKARMDVVRDAISDLEGDASKKAPAEKENKTLSAMRKSNEYHRAFADAMRTGLSPNRACPADSMQVLYDALTISGGSTPGEDGGFLVPEDGDTAIREMMREMGDIAPMFNEENVSTNRGWRVKDTAPEAGFSKLTGEAAENAVPEDDQPEFARVDFTLDTFGLNLPVSRELMQDEDANLLSYIYRWMAKKLTITRNGLLLAHLKGLSGSAITSAADYDVIRGVKKLLNVSLDPMLSADASLITNQDGFNYLDTLADENGRPLLQPDMQSGKWTVFGGREVKVLPNRLLKTESKAAPLYVGNFKQFATLFTRMPMEVASTDVGGNAWRSNSVEIRAIARMGSKVFDSEAAVKATLTIPD